MEKLIEKSGKAEVLKRAIFGMLPKNKLRKQMIKPVKLSFIVIPPGVKTKKELFIIVFLPALKKLWTNWIPVCIKRAVSRNTTRFL